MVIGKVFTLLIFTMLTTIAWAQDDPIFAKSDFDRAVNLAGIDYVTTQNNLDIVIELNKALMAIPAMQKAGVVNPNLGQKDIKLLPVTLTVSVVGMFYTGGILQHVYNEDSTLNIIHVNAYILAADEYGVLSKQACYQFDFNRAIYNKISWSNFTAPSLIGIAPNFAFSTWCKMAFSHETGANV